MNRQIRRWILWGLVAVVALAAWLVFSAYERDRAATAARLAFDSRTIETQAGLVEYAAWGEGPVVLVLHGAAGGYDQGRLIADAFGGNGFRWISPSRFGYLGTPMPPDASVAAQADALADLLKQMEIDRVAVLAMSGGVPVALQLAIRHPDMIRAMALLSSAPYTPMRVQQQGLAVPAWIYQLVFRSDFPFWLIEKTAPGLLERLFDVTPAIKARMRDDDRQFLAGMIGGFEPVSARSAGLINEAAAIDPAARFDLSAITVPTLVVHARDDGINGFGIGEAIAGAIAGAELMPLDDGGHLLIGHHSEVGEQVRSYLGR